MSQWMLQHSEQFIRDMKRLLKRYPRETKQMLLNLDIYKDELETHNNPLLLTHFPFVHRETSGCHAITQQPIKSAAQTRLYLYAYVVDSTIYVLCAGDKASQQADNNYCRDFIKQLNR